jgi:hypothetical protein
MFYLPVPISQNRNYRPIPLESSTLASVLYLPESRELEVEFHSGEIYRYFGVPPQTYYDLPAAPSQGGYYNFNIRNCFDFQKLGCSQPAQNATG